MVFAMMGKRPVLHAHGRWEKVFIHFTHWTSLIQAKAAFRSPTAVASKRLTLGFVVLGFNTNFHELEYNNVHSSFNPSQTRKTCTSQVHQKFQKPESLVWSSGLVGNTT
jgi:hypothetical protein